MTPSLIFNALVARIQADTGTGGLYNGGSYATGGIITDVSAVQASPLAVASGLPAFPYLVITVDMQYDPTFANAVADFTATFELYESRTTGLTANAVRCANRLFGDAMLQAGRTPSYGFDRHVLTLSSDSTLNPLSCVSSPMLAQAASTFSESDLAIKQTLTFAGQISAPAVTP